MRVAKIIALALLSPVALPVFFVVAGFRAGLHFVYCFGDWLSR
jgi:hypothetical protein